MWTSSRANDDEALDAELEQCERAIADLTEACEPILPWDGEIMITLKICLFSLSVASCTLVSSSFGGNSFEAVSNLIRICRGLWTGSGPG